MMDPERQNRLNEIAKIATHLEDLTQVPANLTVAQWALESRWGSRPAGENNYFGIKRAARHTEGCTVSTHEYVDGKKVQQDCTFAAYADLTASASDYAWLISNGKPYQKAWQAYLKDRDAIKLLKGIAGVYATDVSYAKLVQQIAGQGDVVEAIAKARQ